MDEDEAAALAQMGIQAVGDVDEVEAEDLCQASGILPLTSGADLDDEKRRSRHVGHAASTQRAMVGGRSMMHFDITARTQQDGEERWGVSRDTHPHPHAVMLRAPDKGTGKVLTECLQRSFRTLHAWARDVFEDEDAGMPAQSPASVRVMWEAGRTGLAAGAGAAELAIAGAFLEGVPWLVWGGVLSLPPCLPA